MDNTADTIDEYGGIQPPHLAFYMEAIRFNTEAAMSSIDFVAKFIESTQKAEGNYEMTGELQTQILDHLQNMLSHAAALSRYFWPPKPGQNRIHVKRAETLRRKFNLEDDCALKNRNLRNHLEHFDEKLDNYLWAAPVVGYVFPAYVGGELQGNDVPTHLFRAFYVDTGVFETLGVRHEVQPIVDQICSIYDQLRNTGYT